MESTRLKKVSRLLEKDLGEIFQQMAKSTFPGVLLTVTKVRITPDLSVAKAYISIFPVTDSKEIMHHIHTQTNFLRNELANRVRLQLRIIPDLQFFLDDSLDYEENINRLLRGEGENPIL
jgi:ribosome-binding factor A